VGLRRWQPRRRSNARNSHHTVTCDSPTIVRLAERAVERRVAACHEEWAARAFRPEARRGEMSFLHEQRWRLGGPGERVGALPMPALRNVVRNGARQDTPLHDWTPRIPPSGGRAIPHNFT